MPPISRDFVRIIACFSGYPLFSNEDLSPVVVGQGGGVTSLPDR